MNEDSATKCVACEAVRPGYEDKQLAAASSSSSTTAGGSSGFTFSAVGAGAAAKEGDGKGGGAPTGVTVFSFGGATTQTPSSGFSFGTTSTLTSITGEGFNFGFSLKPSTSTDKKDIVKDDKDKKASSISAALLKQGSYPPISATVPKPFGGGTTKPATKSSSVGSYSPMSATTPKPFGATSKPATKTSSAGSYSPMSATAPKPFGSGPKCPKNSKSSSVFNFGISSGCDVGKDNTESSKATMCSEQIHTKIENVAMQVEKMKSELHDVKEVISSQYKLQKLRFMIENAHIGSFSYYPSSRYTSFRSYDSSRESKDLVRIIIQHFAFDVAYKLEDNRVGALSSFNPHRMYVDEGKKQFLEKLSQHLKTLMGHSPRLVRNEDKSTSIFYE